MTSTTTVSGVQAAVRDKHENTQYTAGTVADADRLRTALLPAKGQVQNVPNSRVYVFGNADVAGDELNADLPNSVEMSELRPRSGKVKKKKKNVEPIIIERDIESGDTLQIFSLQFGCPVSFWMFPYKLILQFIHVIIGFSSSKFHKSILCKMSNFFIKQVGSK